MPYVRWFAFLTAGCPKNGGAHNCRAATRSFLGLVYMTCGAWPPCHKVGSLVYAGGDFTRDASGARVRGSAFKKGSIPRAVDMPRSSCDHRALSPSRPPDGVRRRSLVGFASRSSLPATSPSESARSWWCRRSCFLLAAVGGVQPLGSWYPSTIIRLQGFSSHSPVATSGRWSSIRMTTSLVVERSEPGCGLPLPSASRMFIIRAGVEGEPSGSFPFRAGWWSASSSSIRGRRVFAGFGEGADPRYVGSAVCGAVSCRVSGSPAWVLWCRLRRCLLPLGRSVAACPSHGRRPRRARVGHIHGFSRATGRTGRSYKTSYAVGAVAAFLDGLVLTPAVRMGAKTSLCTLVHPLPIGAEVVAASGGADVVASAGEAAHCRGGCLRWRDR
jgi:hypothetical protein